MQFLIENKQKYSVTKYEINLVSSIELLKTVHPNIYAFKVSTKACSLSPNKPQAQL